MKSLNDEIRRFILSHRFKGMNITLSMKQKVDDIWLDDMSVDRNVRYFKNILNKKVFGNSYRRFGRELKSLFVKEYSEDKRHHIHCIIEKPNNFDEEEFRDLIEQSWKKTLFGYDQIHTNYPTSLNDEIGYWNYIMKTKTKVNLMGSIDWINSNCFHRC